MCEKLYLYLKQNTNKDIKWYYKGIKDNFEFTYACIFQKLHIFEYQNSVWIAY